MNSNKLKVGTRGSRLAVAQTEAALERLAALFPIYSFEVVRLETPGDRDLRRDLREAPEDFFTRDLDEALLAGSIDLAIHSAKDLPAAMPEGLDWFWLPWCEDARDAWVLPPGRAMADLPEKPVVGISSARRAAYCAKRLPGADARTVRGAIPERLAQLDAGDYDALLMAGAALNRLGLAERVTEWIPLEELPVPAGQGVLAVTFRLGDPVMTRLRSYFVKAVRFVGAGVGSADYCTLAGLNELRQADVCLYDVLMDKSLLQFLPAHAGRLFVGKRCGGDSQRQAEITAQIARYARQGLRVVRLKGGDPGLFGRLSEELHELGRLGLPYRVYAGVSALTVATTATGLLLTQRGMARGFTAMTPRAADGGVPGVALAERERLPLALFMSVTVAAQMAAQLLAEGWPGTTAVAMVFNAGADDECIWRATLAELAEGRAVLPSTDAPGLLLIGATDLGAWRRPAGALRGCRVLLTCSEALQERAAGQVIDFGGVPIKRPMIRLEPRAEALTAVAEATAYDWLVLTSPTAVELFFTMARQANVDWRHLPRIMACGPGSAEAFRRHGFEPDLTPALEYSAAGLVKALAELDISGQRVLRLRSAIAGPLLAGALSERGAVVNDIVLYDNHHVVYERLPDHDAVFFASASAVQACVDQMDKRALESKVITAIGNPTMVRLLELGHTPDVVPTEATVEGAISALARAWVCYPPAG